jgi:hypothetical protein
MGLTIGRPGGLLRSACFWIHGVTGGLALLSRARQQQRTHERLPEAGRAVFLERGFPAATVEEIAARAGYT